MKKLILILTISFVLFVSGCDNFNKKEGIDVKDLQMNKRVFNSCGNV